VFVAAIVFEEGQLALTPDLTAFEDALSVIEDGAYFPDVVLASEPADEEPKDAEDEEAAGPEPPADALVWICKS
jgi:hypothetical protein